MRIGICIRMHTRARTQTDRQADGQLHTHTNDFLLEYFHCDFFFATYLRNINFAIIRNIDMIELFSVNEYKCVRF